MFKLVYLSRLVPKLRQMQIMHLKKKKSVMDGCLSRCRCVRSTVRRAGLAVFIAACLRTGGPRAPLVSSRVQTQRQSSNIGLVGSHTLLHSSPCARACARVCARARASFPFTCPFCVGVCQRCCLQPGPHCVQPLLLIDTGPLALGVPMAPQATGGRKAETGAPGLLILHPCFAPHRPRATSPPGNLGPIVG